MPSALVFQGGWDGHQPELVSVRFGKILEKNGWDVKISDTLDCLNNYDDIKDYDLFVPVWTCGGISGEQCNNIKLAVAHGAGIAGCHGGMCDSFRNDTEWQFMTGGQWVSHPGYDGTDYIVNIKPGSSPIVEGLEDFPVCSEQYYVHVDPAINVLATTRFPVANYYHASNGAVDVPVAWTKFWGLGRVFYCSLGHQDNVFDNSPTAQVLMERGMLWAGAGKQYVKDHNISFDRFEGVR